MSDLDRRELRRELDDAQDQREDLAQSLSEIAMKLASVNDRLCSRLTPHEARIATRERERLMKAKLRTEAEMREAKKLIRRLSRELDECTYQKRMDDFERRLAALEDFVTEGVTGG
ncbi:MAG: hypothetical protein AAGE52_35205 [Myxococcota bacterium]